MKAKKNSKFDLEGKRTAFFQTGLLGVSALTLAAFAWRSPEFNTQQKNKALQSSSYVYEMEKQKEEEKPKVVLAVVKQSSLKDERTSLDQKKLIDENSGLVKNGDKKDIKSDAGIGNPFSVGDSKFVFTPISFKEELVDFPTIEAAYVGGYVAMQTYIQKKLIYPQTAIELGLQGKVYVEFTIEKNGDISDVKIARGVHEILDKEAVRLIKGMPQWIPGELKAKKVRTRVRLPIVFEIQN